MEASDPFLKAALRKVSYTDYCLARGLHPCFYTLPSTLTGVVQFSRNIFIKPYSAYVFEVLRVASRARFALRRAVMGHFRRKMVAHTTQDLSLSPLSTAPKAHLFSLYADHKKYTFRISDLLSIIHAALTHSMELVSVAVAPSNPYTGVTFRPETLYLIFVAVHESLFFMPPLFHSYVKTNFCLKKFTLKNECALRDTIIKSMVKNFAPKAAHREIRYMLEEIRVCESYSKHNRSLIPNATLLPAHALDQFKPWLYAYYTHLYSFNPYMRQAAYKNLIKSMLEFAAKNKKFGMLQNSLVCTEVLHPVEFVF
jgi:hypothetical protein